MRMVIGITSKLYTVYLWFTWDSVEGTPPWAWHRFHCGDVAWGKAEVFSTSLEGVDHSKDALRQKTTVGITDPNRTVGALM